jgi:uncharacterized protein DUF302
MSKETSRIISHQVVRLDVGVRENYDDFRRRFESAVPAWNQDRGRELVERKAPWPEMMADVAASAPNEFLLYWKLDLTPLMSLAGNTRRATEYLMGNHVIAETMYRHDPSVGLYVPLRCLIYESEEGTHFAIDQPSTTLASVGPKEIAQVGRELDRKVAKLFHVLGIEVPAVLLDERKASA